MVSGINTNFSPNSISLRVRSGKHHLDKLKHQSQAHFRLAAANWSLSPFLSIGLSLTKIPSEQGPFNLATDFQSSYKYRLKLPYASLTQGLGFHFW